MDKTLAQTQLGGFNMLSKFPKIVVILTLCISINSCITKQEAIALADLFLKGFSTDAPSGFVVGAAISTLWNIINKADKNAKETETANLSKLLVEAYKVISENNYKFIDSKVYTTPQIQADLIEQVNVPVTFTEEGTYMLLYKIDANDDVKERNEDNNGGNEQPPVIFGKLNKLIPSDNQNLFLEIEKSNDPNFTKRIGDKSVIFH